ncbi:MAG: hypothetical protein U5L96_13465 [Owenweeksia sp.]|nr:hypothetical protein [Owenweeksia sp.]
MMNFFIGTYKNSDGTQLYISPFGGTETEEVHGLSISNTGVMYFCGSTEGGSSSTASSQSPPSSHTFPVYNPNDGSYFNANHPSQGNKRGFVSAYDLNTYLLEYSSVLPSFITVYDINAGIGPPIAAGGQVGQNLNFDPSAQKFASSLIKLTLIGPS